MLPLAAAAAAAAGPFRQSPAFVPTSPRVAPVSGAAAGRRTKRDMFSLQFNQFNDPGSNQNKDDDDGDDNEEPADWIQALLRWDSRDDKSAAAAAEQQDDNLKSDVQVAGEETTEPKKTKDKSPIPLAALVNVEALLMASGSALDEIDAPSFGIFDGLSAKRAQDGNNNATAVVAAAAAVSNVPVAAASNTTANNANAIEDVLPNPLTLLPKLEEQGDWNKLVSSLQQSVVDRTTTDGEALAFAAENILSEATKRMELFLNETSSVVPPGTVEHLIMRASQALNLDERGSGLKAAADSIVKVAEDLAREQGLNVTEAADRARATTQYTAQLVDTANGLLVAGYVHGEDEAPPGFVGQSPLSPIDDFPDIAMGIQPATSDRKSAYSPDAAGMKPLFHNFQSAKPVHKDDYKHAVKKSAQMASLSGAIYMNTIEECHKIGQALVANGTSADVAWMVTDSVGYEDDYREEQMSDKTAASRDPVLVRTITIRGFDASDESVDRELLLYRICEGEKVALGNSGILVHKGLLLVAEELYDTLTTYIDFAASTHKLVLNGHSIGGSLSVLLMMLLVDRRGIDYVKENFLRVYTFGSPPISISPDAIEDSKKNSDASDVMRCPTLEAIGLESDFVYQYVQPWDPVARLFSDIDPCYPLLEDIGDDGVTLYASGPSRALRPITRAIIESWEGWPRFRDGFREQSNQGYTGVGVQHLLLPEPTRYLTDRLVSVNIAIPPVYSVVQLNSREILPALKETFPLDEFSISFVPAALRSFIHHFYPAYTSPFVEYANGKTPVPQEIEVASPPIADADTRANGARRSGNIFKWPILGKAVVNNK